MRFRVVSVTGHTIKQNFGGSGSSGRKPRSIWYVLDSADCFHIVREFRYWSNGRDVSAPEDEARAYAAELEAAYP